MEHVVKEIMRVEQWHDILGIKKSLSDEWLEFDFDRGRVKVRKSWAREGRREGGEREEEGG